ncbi:MAG: UxaA family hydrolase [Negativicutes bacterium]
MSGAGGNTMFQAIQLEHEDNVATVIIEVAKGTAITVQSPGISFELAATDDIPYCHKVALGAIRKGDNVIKYGRPIGRATCDISEGSLVGVHNIEGMRGRGDLAEGKAK